MNYLKDSYIGSLTSISLCTVSQVCQYLDVSSPSDSLTAFVSSTINRVSKKFETYCQLPLREQSFIGYYDGNGSNELFVNNYPITSLSSIKYRVSPISSYSNNISVSACSVYAYKIVAYNTAFPCGNLSIEIVYNAGYSIVPEDIEQAAIEATAIVIKESSIAGAKSQSILGETSRQADGTLGANTSFIDLTPKHKDILDKYRKIY